MTTEKEYIEIDFSEDWHTILMNAVRKQRKKANQSSKENDLFELGVCDIDGYSLGLYWDEGEPRLRQEPSEDMFPLTVQDIHLADRMSDFYEFIMEVHSFKTLLRDGWRMHSRLGTINSNEQAYTFKPGKMGIGYDDKGVVTKVEKGAPADVMGLTQGAQIVKFALDGAAEKRYSKIGLANAETGTSGYTVTVSYEDLLTSAIRISVIGDCKKGKTWLLSKLCNEDFGASPSVKTPGLCWKRWVIHKKQFILIDSKGENSPLTRVDNNKPMIYKPAEEDLLREIIVSMADVIIFMVSSFGPHEQISLQNLSRELTHEYRRCPVSQLLVIHNLKHIKDKKKFNEAFRQIAKVLDGQQFVFDGKTVGIHPREGPQVHFVLGCQGEASGEHNDFVIKYLKQWLVSLNNPLDRANILDELKQLLKDVVPKYLSFRRITAMAKFVQAQPFDRNARIKAEIHQHVEFKPGKMGIKYDEEGIVTNVEEGAPADVMGVTRGDQIVNFEDSWRRQAYSKVALTNAETGTSGYGVTFRVSSAFEKYDGWERYPTIISGKVVPEDVPPRRLQSSVPYEITRFVSREDGREKLKLQIKLPGYSEDELKADLGKDKRKAEDRVLEIVSNGSHVGFSVTMKPQNIRLEAPPGYAECTCNAFSTSNLTDVHIEVKRNVDLNAIVASYQHGIIELVFNMKAIQIGKRS